MEIDSKVTEAIALGLLCTSEALAFTKYKESGILQLLLRGLRIAFPYKK
jgi:hypothetical protein